MASGERLDASAEDVQAAQVLEDVLRGELTYPDGLLHLRAAAHNRAMQLERASQHASHRASKANELMHRAHAFAEEARLWCFLWHLSHGRRSLVDEPHRLHEQSIEEKLTANDASPPLRCRLRQIATGSAGELKRLNQVVSWLEDVHARQIDEEENALHGLSSLVWQNEGIWQSTARFASSAQTAQSRYAHELDPDGPSRTGKALEAGDAGSDIRILQSLWRLFQAGRFRSARALCQHAGQHWRALSLGESLQWSPAPVGMHARDEAASDASEASEEWLHEQVAYEIDGCTSLQRLYWKWSCYKAASQAHNAGHSTEGNIYGLLSGTPRLASRGARHDWHEQLWLRCRCALDRWVDRLLFVNDYAETTMETEDALTERIRLGNESQGNAVDWPPPDGRIDSGALQEESSLLQDVDQGSDDEAVLAQIMNDLEPLLQEKAPWRVKILCDIEHKMALAHWDDLLTYLNSIIRPLNGNDRGNNVFEVYNMRLASTLLVFLSSNCLDPSEHMCMNGPSALVRRDNVLRAYVWHLIDSEQTTAVPMFARFMQSATIKLTYTFLLEFNLLASAEHKDSILRSARAHLPRARDEGSVDKILEAFFASLSSIDHMARRNDPSLSFVPNRCKALEWPAFDRAPATAEVANAALRVIRDLVMGKYLQSAKDVFESILYPNKDVFITSRSWPSDSSEWSAWEEYLRCFDLINRFNFASDKASNGASNEQNAVALAQKAADGVVDLLASTERWLDPGSLHRRDYNMENDIDEQREVEIELVLRSEEQSAGTHPPEMHLCHSVAQRFAGRSTFWSIGFRNDADKAVDLALQLLRAVHDEGNLTLVYSKCLGCNDERDEMVARELVQRCSLPPLIIESAKAEAYAYPGRGKIVSHVAKEDQQYYRLFTAEQLQHLLMVEADSELNALRQNDSHLANVEAEM